MEKHRTQCHSTDDGWHYLRKCSEVEEEAAPGAESKEILIRVPRHVFFLATHWCAGSKFDTTAPIERFDRRVMIWSSRPAPLGCCSLVAPDNPCTHAPL